MTNLQKLYQIQELINKSQLDLQVNDVHLELNEYIQTLITIEQEYV